MKTFFTTIVITLLSKSNFAQNDSFKDPRDGRIYSTITIGTQVWMAENLAYKTINTLDNHGNIIAMCTGYQNNITDASKFGYLYSFEAAKISCPSGWHLPSDAEWDVLINFLGGAIVAGGKMKETSTAHWKSTNIDASNVSGFTALPGGCHNYGAGHYENISEAGFWWSSTKNDNGGTWIRALESSNGKVNRMMDIDYVESISFSVRCIKDSIFKTESSNEKALIDRVLGVWKYKDATIYNKDESKNYSFLKITRAINGKFNLKRGIDDNDIVHFGNIDGSVGNGIDLNISNNKLVGQYRYYEGSAPDAFSDINISIQLDEKNNLIYKSNYESFVATKIN